MSKLTNNHSLIPNDIKAQLEFSDRPTDSVTFEKHTVGTFFPLEGGYLFETGYTLSVVVEGKKWTHTWRDAEPTGIDVLREAFRLWDLSRTPDYPAIVDDFIESWARALTRRVDHENGRRGQIKCSLQAASSPCAASLTLEVSYCDDSMTHIFDLKTAQLPSLDCLAEQANKLVEELKKKKKAADESSARVFPKSAFEELPEKAKATYRIADMLEAVKGRCAGCSYRIPPEKKKTMGFCSLRADETSIYGTCDAFMKES